jgi:ABC-type lipoprotein export system ATPase subunit
MTEEVIKIERLYKQYTTDAGTVPVLHDISLSVMPGEFVAIMGPSGRANRR